MFDLFFYVNYDVNLMSFKHKFSTQLAFLLLFYFSLAKAICKYQQIDMLLVNLAQKLKL